MGIGLCVTIMGIKIHVITPAWFVPSHAPRTVHLHCTPVCTFVVQSEVMPMCACVLDSCQVQGACWVKKKKGVCWMFVTVLLSVTVTTCNRDRQSVMSHLWDQTKLELPSTTALAWHRQLRHHLVPEVWWSHHSTHVTRPYGKPSVTKLLCFTTYHAVVSDVHSWRKRTCLSRRPCS